MVPAALARALLAPVPALATDRGAVVITPAGVLELERVSPVTWAWRAPSGRWWVVVAGEA